MKIFLRVLMAAGAIGASLVSAGVIPAAFGVVFTAVGGIAAALHPSPQAMAAFGDKAK